MPQYMATPECSWRDYCQEQASLPELSFTQCPCPPRSLPWQGPPMENGMVLSIHKHYTLASFTVLVLYILLIFCACAELCLFCCYVCTGYQLRASIYSYGPADSQPSPFSLDASIRSAEALTGTKNTFNFPFFL